jgi:Ca-activated chloride channel family protein
MAADDFEDDTKDGGEVGAGQQVTVFYELVLGDGSNGKDLKYQDNSTLSDAAYSNEILTMSINYKEVDEDKSQTEEYPVLDEETAMSEDFSFSVGVIETAMVVRDSEYKGTSSIGEARKYAKEGTKDNEYREEFVKLLKNLE